MKSLLLWCAFFAALDLHCQMIPAAHHYSENSIFMVCRGTRHKIGVIPAEFNLRDRHSTHVAIAVVEKGVLSIYHVTNDRGEKSALTRESLSSFVAETDVLYWSIWEYRSNPVVISKLKKLLRTALSKKIVFDMDFESGNDKLYCSEFCAEILQKLNPDQLTFQRSKKALNFIYRTALDKKILDYYPVDFFQNDSRFQKIRETFVTAF